jgi:hypothetical protein
LNQIPQTNKPVPVYYKPVLHNSCRRRKGTAVYSGAT